MGKYLDSVVDALAFTNAHAISRDLREERQAKQEPDPSIYSRIKQAAGFFTVAAAEGSIAGYCINEAVHGNNIPIYVYGGLKVLTNGGIWLAKRTTERVIEKVANPE